MTPDPKNIALQLESALARAADAEQRLVIAQAVVVLVLGANAAGVGVTPRWIEDRVGSRLAAELVREQEDHARTRARLADALRQLEELQASGRLQSAFERAAIAITGRPYSEVAAELASTADEDR